MEIQPSDVADRFSILSLKMERQPVTPELQREFDAFASCLQSLHLPKDLVERLTDINGRIWDLESDIRQGKEHQLGLEEVGRRALAIRDLNSQRIATKNLIAQLTHGYSEVKHNHASALVQPHLLGESPSPSPA